MIWPLVAFLYALHFVVEVLVAITGFFYWGCDRLGNFLRDILPSPIFLIRHGVWQSIEQSIEQSKKAWRRLLEGSVEERAQPFLRKQVVLEWRNKTLQRRIAQALPGTRAEFDIRNELRVLDNEIFANDVNFELVIRKYAPREEYYSYCSRYNVTPALVPEESSSPT